MNQVNINTPSGGPPPRRPPSRWPLYAFVAIVVALLLAGIAVAAIRSHSQQAAGRPTATPTSGPAASATATPTPGAPTATPTALATPQPPTNPTALHVTSGSCTVHHITWIWSGAQRATSYDVVLYDPRTGATVKTATTSAPSYTLPAGPGATVALKARSRNAAGTAPSYFTPGSIGRVPPTTTNPTTITVSTTGHTMTWFWSGAQQATAYDVVLYHYSGSSARTDITARTDKAHWGTTVTPGITYHLKVRSVGVCAPATYYTPSTAAVVGATPTASG